MNDKNNYKIFRWIDNSVVKMVSTVHTGCEGENIEANRRRPRVNPINKNNVAHVWGNEHRRKVKIPLIINDYNHWMNGVDIADQLIANYRAKLRCRRTWMPLMFHSLDILRINMYIAHHRIQKKKTSTHELHKSFAMGLVVALRLRSREAVNVRKGRGDRTTRSAGVAPAVVSPNKRRKTAVIERKRMSSTDPGGSLCEKRFDKVSHDHLNVGRNARRECEYCKYEKAEAKLEGKPPPRLNPCKIQTSCTHCQPLTICQEHWDIYIMESVTIRVNSKLY